MALSIKLIESEIEIDLIPIGEEENTREAEENAQSESERNTFLDTDVRKSLDDKLQSITGSLSKFEHQHALVSSQLLSDIERIEDPKDKNKHSNTSDSHLRTLFLF